ncbi:MAG: anti-sigma factor antagonist [Candidatus Rokubacteria bacterium]|nr:anti-sigma factor antagonist [Candidatus Rokubacteria bacterium]
MSDKPPLDARETLSEWAERAWQARRGEKAAPDNGARDADTLEDAITQRATKWMEEGRFLVGLLQELLNENEQLRTRAAALEQDLQRLQELRNENEQSKARAAALEQDLQRLQELVNENEQLRTRAAALEQDLERLRHEQGGLRREREDIVEVAPKGDLDMASVSQMKLQDYINAGRIKLVLDLESIEYIDSAGLGEIVRAMKRAREAGGDLRLCGVQGQVGKIIEITGLNKAIAVYATREEAVASWNS